MARLITLLVAGALAAGAQAQTVWSLDSCVNYAIEHNVEVRSRILQTQSAEYDVTEAKDRFLPTVQGYAGQNFSFGRGLTSENTYANNNTQNFNIGANLSLPIFQGLAGVRRVDYAKASLRAAVEQTEAAKENVELNVLMQYLQVLYCREVQAVAEEQRRMSGVELDRRRTLVQNGKLPELDLYEAESQLAQDELSVVTTANDTRLALVDLAQLLNLPEVESFDIAPLTGEEKALLHTDADELYRMALERNHTVKASQLNVAAADKQISLAKTGWFPTLSFSAGLGTNYYRMSRYENPSFSSQMRHNFSQSIGFNLSVPIFDGFSTRNSVRKARLQKFNAELQLDDARNQLYKAVQQAYYQAVGAVKKLESAEVAVNAGEKSLAGVREKYNYGKATSTEFEQARSTYVRARLQAVQARYEMLLRNRILAFYTR